jgi:hypothetical protein
LAQQWVSTINKTLNKHKVWPTKKFWNFSNNK